MLDTLYRHISECGRKKLLLRREPQTCRLAGWPVTFKPNKFFFFQLRTRLFLLFCLRSSQNIKQIGMPEADILEIYETDSAREAARVVPDNVLQMAHLPSSNVPVVDFVAWELPHLSSEIIPTKAEKWFSKDSPSISFHVLLSRPVPSGEFVRKLDIAYGQAWLDGAQSIIDYRFNNGSDRLPLWVISFWQKVATVKEIQVTWRKVLAWLDLEEERQKRGEGRIATQKARTLLQSTVGWNKEMKYCNGMTTTYHLSCFLGTLWLSDEHISMMVEELVCDLNTSELLDVHLASFNFTVEIDSIKLKLALPLSAKKKTNISKYEDLVKNGSLRQLYFPLHINTNHWIAGQIDFEKKTISFGIHQYLTTY